MESVPTPVRARVSLAALMVFILLLAGCGGEVPQGRCIGAACPGGDGSASAPTLSVAAGNTENVLTFTPPAGVTAPTFDIYWSTSPDVTTATGTRITAQTSPFHHTGLTNGTPIFYVATITGGTGASAVAGGMPGRWTPLLQGSTSGPPARDSHTAVYDSGSDTMIVFGGRGAGVLVFNDLWLLQHASATSLAWKTSTPAQIGLLGHTAVYNAQAKEMTIYGGAVNSAGSSLSSQIFGVSHADGTNGQPQWVPLPSTGTPPSARWGHAAVYDLASDTMIVFGGTAQTGQTILNEVWVLRQATTSAPVWQQINPTGIPPSPRCCMAAAYDPVNRRMIIFGGSGFNQTGPARFADLWTLTFDSKFLTATWQQLNPSGGAPPDARCCSAAIWDGSKLLLFGGGDFGNPSSDDKIHALVLQPFNFATADGPGGGPAPRVFPTAVPAPRFLLFGGSTASGSLNDLWRLD